MGFVDERDMRMGVGIQGLEIHGLERRKGKHGRRRRIMVTSSMHDAALLVPPVIRGLGFVNANAMPIGNVHAERALAV